MKKNRLEKVIEIITEHEIETQDELIEYLRREGFDVTQATVSRDIRELKLVKIMTGRGSYRYVMPQEDATSQTALHISSALAETIVRVEFTGNLVVLHTLSGMANALATEVDRLHHPSLLGCVAGDDTILTDPPACQGVEAVNQQGFSGARLTRQDAQTLGKVDIRLPDDCHIPDVERAEHIIFPLPAGSWCGGGSCP